MGRPFYPDHGTEREKLGIMRRDSQTKDRKKPNLGRRIAASLMRFWLTLRYRWLSRRYGKLVVEEIHGLPLVILPDVFNPVLLRSGEQLARFIDSYDISRESTVLDLGTGSGVGAIFAARRSAFVTAVDLNPSAVRCARINTILNDLEERITLLHGDLFEPVQGCQFDLILFNPPFYIGKPADELDRAWRGEEIFERFASELHSALAPGGCALLILSTDGEGEALLALLHAEGFNISIAEKVDLINEVMTIYEVTSSKKRTDV